MIKKILLLGVIAIMGLVLFAGCGSNYDYQESDFILEISVDKLEVTIGDTIHIVATLKNLSGKDIRIENFSDKIERIISIYIYNDPTQIISVPGGPNKKRKKFVLKKDALISVSREFIIDGQLMDIEIDAGVSFYIGKSNESTYIKSDIIKILVKE